MSDPLPKSLVRFGDELERAIERDLDHRRARGSARRRLGKRRRRYTVAPAIAAVAFVCAAATIVLSVALRGSTAAYALRLSHDGTLTLTIRDLTRAAPELNARFRAMGIDQRVVPIRRGCQQRRRVNYPNQRPTQEITFIPTTTPAPSSPRGAARSERVDVLAAARQPNGRVSLTLLRTRRPAPSCFGTATSTTHAAMSARAPRVVPRLRIASSS
jgi:hypothetical protein